MNETEIKTKYPNETTETIDVNAIIIKLLEKIEENTRKVV